MFFSTVLLFLFPPLTFPLFQLSHRADHHMLELVDGNAKRLVDLIR